ncbi:MAG TPA: TetR family transcriptional regulator, partial [Hydrogenophaga sp.]|nr:TetR family transcriptional regulator [Hydrogenophaga sp.]
LRAYFSHLAMGPALVRTLFVEIHQLGPAGMQMRREVMRHLADFMLATVNADPITTEQQAEFVAVRELSPTMALAAVGGIHELVLHAIETRQEAQLAELTPQAAAIVRALVRA